MVKNAHLTSFIAVKTPLLTVVNKKIITAKVNNVNELLNSKLKIDINTISDLLNSIEAKFRKCEMIYIAYFEDIDHNLLSGNSATLPYSVDCTFIDSTASLKYIFNCDDLLLYKELIDINFQNFILMVSSIYENLVMLAEIMIKKVIVHTKDKTPISSPLHDYLGYLDVLINLGYRKNDELRNCITAFNPFFQTYLLTINKLRNSFIHGYSINLKSDGFNYNISNFSQGAFAVGSPLLNVDIFTKAILDNTRNFIQALYPALEKSARHHKKYLPA